MSTQGIVYALGRHWGKLKTKLKRKGVDCSAFFQELWAQEVAWGCQFRISVPLDYIFEMICYFYLLHAWIIPNSKLWHSKLCRIWSKFVLSFKAYHVSYELYASHLGPPTTFEHFLFSNSFFPIGTPFFEFTYKIFSFSSLHIFLQYALVVQYFQSSDLLSYHMWTLSLISYFSIYFFTISWIESTCEGVIKRECICFFYYPLQQFTNGRCDKYKHHCNLLLLGHTLKL